MRVWRALGALVGAAIALSSAGTALAQANDPVAELESPYHQQQFDRLVQQGSREDLLAAVLIGVSAHAKRTNAQGFDAAVDRLAREYPDDTIVAYVAALACHVQVEPCRQGGRQARLLELDPRNAIHYLLVPNGGALPATVLAQAASAPVADTHFSALLGLVRGALRGQPAPPSAFDDQPGGAERALALRRNAVLQVPWPRYGAVAAVCTPALAAEDPESPTRKACADLGRLLVSEAGDNIVTRMVGSSTVRRFLRGTPAAAEALALRAQYVWLSERAPESDSSSELELLQDEEIEFGEWEAYKRKAVRAGIPLTPPADWTPARPKALLLPEETTASP